MPTSGTSNFTISANECITSAFEDIGVYGSGETVSSYDYGVAKNRLNMLLKSWQNFAEHLWVRQKVTMFLQKGQSSYSIMPSYTGVVTHVTADTIIQDNLTADVIPLVTTILHVSDSSQFTINQTIGVQLSTGYLFWSTIDSLPTSTTISLDDVLPDAALSGAFVFAYTNNLQYSFNIYSAIRRLISSNIDIPLIRQSFTDYLFMPNKSSVGIPNLYSTDRQNDQMIINVWPTPSDSTYYLILASDRRIQDINSSVDNFDIPQEWAEAISLNLALRLAPAYGKAQGENFQELKMQAKESLLLALENDNELGAIYIVPARSGIRSGR